MRALVAAATSNQTPPPTPTRAARLLIFIHTYCPHDTMPHGRTEPDPLHVLAAVVGGPAVCLRCLPFEDVLGLFLIDLAMMVAVLSPVPARRKTSSWKTTRQYFNSSVGSELRFGTQRVSHQVLPIYVHTRAVIRAYDTS